MKRFGWTGVPLKRARISWAIALVALSAALSYPDPPGRRDNGSCPHGCGVCRGSFEECPCEPGKVHDFKNKTCVPNLCQPPDKCQAAAQPAIDRLRQQADAARKKIH